MKTYLFWGIWLFVLVVSVYDVYFAVLHRETMTEWELNPFALLLLEHIGLLGAIIFRFSGVIAACCLTIFAPGRTKWIGSLFVALVHIGLLCMYCT